MRVDGGARGLGCPNAGTGSSMGPAVLRDLGEAGMAHQRGIQSPVGADAEAVSGRTAEGAEAEERPVRDHVARVRAWLALPCARRRSGCLTAGR